MNGLSLRDSRRIIEKRRKKLERRLRRIQWEDQHQPMLNGSNIHYEVSEKVNAISCGGIGAIHKMVQWSGLVKGINVQLKLLKCHVPYHESDHVLNMTYNILSGGKRLEDIELNRNNEAYMDALGAQRIPDPTTAGDFTRRFLVEDNITLMECINDARKKFWRITKNDNLKEALIDIDGTIAPTYGECKDGMDISYKGIWGYAPLIITLANTKEVLYLVN
ncbi:MAG: IS1380 family transposase, partial [Gammaproteobacteria bacterium]|nr:IS1380 family transposase [Gammaproteobacteria bacterium]